MKFRFLTIGLLCVFALSGCNFINQFINPTEEGEPMQDGSESSVPTAPEPAVNAVKKQKEMEIKQQFGEEGGEYREYQEGDIGNGQDSVLFFYASWCPDCQRHDASLQDWYSANYIPLSVYKVDYDSAIGLRQRYGVEQQNTFVRINGAGTAVLVKSAPTEIDMLNMLRP